MIVQKQNSDWEIIVNEAWKVRENAYLIGKTKVGSALLTTNGKVYSGCNIEHKYRSHDIHAEVNAISSMIANGEKIIAKILIVAERNMFTPCGSCMDWIMQFGDDNTLVAFQNKKGEDLTIFYANELMPYYPK